jgi:hypothetical protein
MDGGAHKLDSEKNRLFLLPPDALEEIGAVMTMGAEKYSDRNWERGWRGAASMALSCGISLRIGRVRTWTRNPGVLISRTRLAACCFFSATTFGRPG